MSSPPILTWRPISPTDIPSLTTISTTIHPSLTEHPSVFTERIALFSSGCFALVHSVTAQLCGYAISHPIRYRRPPALDSFLGEIADDANMYYIHDIAILPEFQGRGYARACVEMIVPVASKYETTGLVSVYGTAEFWARFGFAESSGDESLQTKIVEYGNGAVWLERRNNGCCVRVV